MNNKFYCINLGITKCYLVECPEGYLLIDTSYAKDYRKFLKALKRIGVDISKIKYLLLTHHHDDHAGFAAELVEQTGAKIIVHKNAVRPLKKGASEKIVRSVNRCVKILFSIYMKFHRNFTYPSVTLTEKDIILSGDDFSLLEKLGVNGRIVSTPGHTRDSISVIFYDGISFVGDVAMNFLNFCGIKYRPIFVEDIDTVFESWKKLVENGARIIYPAHGKPFAADKLIFYRRKFTGV